NHNAPRTPFKRLALGAVMARADGVVALSDVEAAREKRFHSLAGALHIAIPTGVDPRRFSPRVQTRPNVGEPWRLLFAGQLIPMKRVDILLEAIASLRERFLVELK